MGETFRLCQACYHNTLKSRKQESGRRSYRDLEVSDCQTREAAFCSLKVYDGLESSMAKTWCISHTLYNC